MWVPTRFDRHEYRIVQDHEFSNIEVQNPSHLHTKHIRYCASDSNAASKAIRHVGKKLDTMLRTKRYMPHQLHTSM
jgi:hypothetical protein